MKSYISATLLILSSSLACAGDLKYEAGLKYSFFSYDDNKGSANLDSAFTPNVNISYELAGRGKRTSVNLDYYSTSGKASNSETGQNANGYGITAKYHYQLNLSRNFQDFWISAGGKYSQIKLDSRHTVDSDGFLIEKFPNTTVNTTALALSANKLFYVDSRKKTAINAGVFYDLPLGSGISEFGIVTNFNF